MTVLDINGTTFEYVERGTGEPVVLVHGSASDYRTWQAQLVSLGHHYRTIAYSRRYHWPNERIPPGADYSMEEHVSDLQAIVESFGTGPVHLVGHSYGAFVSLLLAVRQPEVARTLVLAEPPVISLFMSNSPKVSEILKLSLRRPRTAASILNLGVTGVRPATEAARRGDGQAATLRFGKAVLGREYFRRLSQSRLEQVRANSIREEFLGSGYADLRDEELRELRTPTLLVSGQNSPRFFHRLLDRLEELLPLCRRIEIQDASHIMHEDNADAYNEALLSFWASQRAGASRQIR